MNELIIHTYKCREREREWPFQRSPPSRQRLVGGRQMSFILFSFSFIFLRIFLGKENQSPLFVLFGIYHCLLQPAITIIPSLSLSLSLVFAGKKRTGEKNAA